MSKPNRIIQLSPWIANQIAAGEVIERPASVVKELLENAFDAEARTIIIDIGFGGLNQIKIADDGHGILAEDLPLALSSHATSKIRELEDLYSIKSMGFRGEALASIASISKLSISSKPENQEQGMIVNNHSASLKLLPFPRSKGTTIEVCDLFCSTPVRKKFLKSERIEFQAIEAVVRRLALSASNVRIQLHHNGKLQLDLPPAFDENSNHLRINKILGKVFLEESLFLNVNHDSLKLKGFISNRHYQRSQNDKMMIYLNNRMVKDKLLYHAIKQAYEDLLHPGKHPACLLYLDMNPEEVDVNVHPTKHEVRFHEPRIIHDFLTTALRKALNQPSEPSPPQVLLKKENYQTFELRENTASYYQNENLPASKFHWKPLNRRFALLNSYLIDVTKLYQQYLSKRLEKEKRPLAARPLLVPLTYTLTKELQDLPEEFANLGIQLLQKSPLQLVIRSLPVLAPHTAIMPFLKACLEKNEFNLNDLVLHQSLDAYDCTLEEQQYFLEQISAMGSRSLESSPDSGKAFILLTETFCKALFHD